MSLFYTAFADEDVMGEDVIEEEVIYEEVIPEEEVIEEITETVIEDVVNPEIYEENIYLPDVGDYNIVDEKIKVYVNGRRILFDADPMLVNGRTIVPVRAIAESYNCNVDWINDTRTVTILSK